MIVRSKSSAASEIRRPTRDKKTRSKFSKTTARV
jgi:hypothetical protein